MRWTTVLLTCALLCFALYGCGGTASDQATDPDPTPTPSPPQHTMSIAQHGITWYFDQAYEYGRFVNGDYWIVGPVTLTAISPACTEINGLVVNGAMVDPKPSDFQDDGPRNQGYGETVPNYNPAYNAALPGGNPLSETNTLTIQPGSSIVSTISTPGEGYGPAPNSIESYDTHLRTCAILTVLDTAPSEDSFRPSYCDHFKMVKYNESMINGDLLQRLTITGDILNTMLSDPDIHIKIDPENETDALNSIAAHFERPWLDYIPFSSGRPYHPIDNMPVYGYDISNFVSLAAVMLHLDYTYEQKRTLLIRFIQYGIDLYGVSQVEDGNKTWPGGGGQSSGRKWPIVFAGIMLNDTTGMMAIGSKSGDYAKTNGNYSNATRLGPPLPDDYIHFGEDDQTFYVSQELIDTHSAYVHDPANYEPPEEGNLSDPSYASPPEFFDDYDSHQYFYPYRQSDLGLAEYGQKHWSYPGGVLTCDTKYWYQSYRHVTAPSWTGFILAALIMQDSGTDIKALWNHDALFDYIDRYVEIQQTLYPAYMPHSSGTVGAVWDEYRADY